MNDTDELVVTEVTEEQFIELLRLCGFTTEEIIAEFVDIPIEDLETLH